MFYSIFVSLTVIAYLTAFTLSWRSLRHPQGAWPASIVGIIAVLIHLALLAHVSLLAHSMMLGFGSALSLFAWQTAVLMLVFSLRQPVASLGLIVYPAAAIAVLANVAVPLGDDVLAPLAWPVQTHILLSLLAYGVLTLGAVQATVLAIQHRQLHNRSPGGDPGQLPPLETMERGLFQLIAVGLFLLTFAIASGMVFVDNMFAQHLAHKTILSFLAWIFFAVLLWGRWQFGWRGRMAIRWTLAGYVLLVLAYFGSKLVLEQILDEHWYMT